jgi:hypothetical protein
MRRLLALSFAGGLLAVPLTGHAQLGINTYGDIGYEVDRATNPSQTTNAFSTPRLELFLTETQGRLAFLAETMFEVGEDNSFGIDVERVEVAYIFSDVLRIRGGRFHTAIGYYNDAYHHGRYFQTTVDRPEMVRFEDEGGLIPAHSVGLHADGRLSLGHAGALRYDADLANGRGHLPDEVTNLTDANGAKAYNIRLRLEPAFADGLILGGNAYFDTINAAIDPQDPAAPRERIRELILGAHVVYLEHNIHFIAEYLHVSHKVSATGYASVTQAGFVELGYTLGRITPYARIQRVSFPATLDLFYANNVLGQLGSLYASVAGLRFEMSDYLAFKLEGGYISQDSGRKTTTGAAQCAFAF